MVQDIGKVSQDAGRILLDVRRLTQKVEMILRVAEIILHRIGNERGCGIRVSKMLEGA